MPCNKEAHYAAGHNRLANEQSMNSIGTSGYDEKSVMLKTVDLESRVRGLNVKLIRLMQRWNTRNWNVITETQTEFSGMREPN